MMVGNCFKVAWILNKILDFFNLRLMAFQMKMCAKNLGKYFMKERTLFPTMQGFI